jgi:acetolactate synthase regulatory subunit
MNTTNKRVVNHRLSIEFNGVEGAFLRIIGLMERRAYHLQSCQLNRGADDKCVAEVTVASDRPADLLKRQLERLYNVTKVEIHSSGEKPAVRRVNIRAQA